MSVQELLPVEEEIEVVKKNKMGLKYGKNLESGKDFDIDIESLIATRMLLEGNSGSGKSYAIRRLCEITNGKVQQILIDMEGEFATLREKFDYLVIGKNGDRSTDVNTADVLARRLLELRASTIIDLSDLRLHERIKYVHLFLESLMDAPRELWHPLLVIIDEAHVFSPEAGEAESSESVIALATQGRKRGFAAILATQRISQLSKVALAQMNNVLIGHTWLDNDKKRCGEVLGFTSKEQTNSLRDLKPGQFYAFGPAFSAGVELVQVDRVVTRHPEPGEQMPKVPPITEGMRKELAKLEDIQEVKQRELKEREDFVKEIRRLQGELRAAKSSQGKINPEQLKDIKDRAYALGQKAMEQQVSSQLKQSQSLIKRYQQGFAGIGKIASDVAGMSVPEFKAPEIASPVRRPVVLPSPVPVKATTAVQTDIELGRCERAILKFLAMRPDKDFTKQQVGAMTNYSPTSGGFSNAVSKLNTSGLINYGNNRLSLSQQRLDDVIAFLGNEYSEPSKDALESWLGKLELAPRKIYELLLRNPDQTFSKQEIAEQTGYSAGSGGFSNAISNLNALGLIEKTGEGIRLNQELRDL